MPLVIPCPSCGARLKAPENLIGKTVKCPNCQTAIAVKAPASAPTPARQPAVAKAPRKPAPEPVEDFDDLEEERPARRPAPRSKGRDDDYDDAPPPRKSKSRDDDEYTDAPPPRKSKARPEPEDEYDDLDEGEEQPRKKGKKGKDYAPPGGSTTDQERTNAMIIYVAAIVSNIIGFGPLGGIIWWFIKRGESKFVDHHGKEFLNLMITGFLAYLGCFAIIGVGVALMIAISDVWFLGAIVAGLGGLVAFAYGLTLTVLFFIAMFKAKGGVWYRFPMILHILKV
jgi:uncharacterized Tic20 family protein